MRMWKNHKRKTAAAATHVNDGVVRWSSLS